MLILISTFNKFSFQGYCLKMAGEFYKLVKTLDLFELLEKVQDNIIFLNDLQKFGLSAPVCIMNEQAILEFYLSEKWLNDFPKQSLILKLIEEDKKLFYLPEPTYYYLYYHLLRAFSNYLETGQKIYDEDSPLNYDRLNDEIIEKQLNATKFFEIYLRKGSNFSEEDFFLAKKDKDEENVVSELSEFSLNEKNESVQEPAGEPEPETKQDDNSQIEVEFEEIKLDEEVKFESFV